MPIINSDEVKQAVNKLFDGGSTSNEMLQDLLWKLKMLSELSDEDLGIKSEDDRRYFFTIFFTELANAYKPTNSSELPRKLLQIHSSNAEFLQSINQLYGSFEHEFAENFLSDKKTKNDLHEQHFKFRHDLSNLIRNQYIHSQNAIEEWLKKINY